MQKLTASVLLALGALMSASLFAQAPAPAAKAASTGGASPHETISQTFDNRRDARVVVVYGRPYSRKGGTGEPRKIWGELVPYGKVWRLGSDEATLLLTQQPIVLGGKELEAGAYTLDMQPEADGSAKLIIGKRLGQWGIPYNGNSEIARVDMTKESVEKNVEQFTIVLDRNPAGGGFLRAIWENTQFSVPFTIKKA